MKKKINIWVKLLLVALAAAAVILIFKKSNIDFAEFLRGTTTLDRVVEIVGEDDTSWKEFFKNPEEEVLAFKDDFGKLVKASDLTDEKKGKLKNLKRESSEEQFKNKIKSFGIWAPVVYIIIYVIRPIILFPAGILSATAGIIWGTWLGFFILQIAANISSTAEFLFARYFARDAIEKKLGSRIQGLDAKIEKHGFLTVLLIRLIPNVAWDIQNLTLGLTKVKFRDYFLATFIGIMPGSFAFVFFGSSLIKVLFDPKNIIYVIIAVLIFAGVIALQKFLKKKQSNTAGPAVDGGKG